MSGVNNDLLQHWIVLLGRNRGGDVQPGSITMRESLPRNRFAEQGGVRSFSTIFQ